MVLQQSYWFFHPLRYYFSSEVLQLYQLLYSSKALSSSATYVPIRLYCSMVLNSYFLDMQKMHVNVMVIFSCSYILNSQSDSWYQFSSLKTKVDIFEILKPVSSAVQILCQQLVSVEFVIWPNTCIDLFWFLFSCASSESPLSPTNQNRKKIVAP